MTLLPSTLFFLTFLSLLLGHPIRAQELSPSEREQLGKIVSQIEETLTGGVSNNNERALSTCIAAAGSPKAAGTFFMECTKVLDFEEAGKRESDWREWRDANEDWIESDDHLLALQLQLRFLILKLQFTKAATTDEEHQAAARDQLIPAIMRYYDEVAASISQLEGQRSVLTSSVSNSKFAKRLKLDITLDVPEPWVDSPLPVDAVYEQVILPNLREGTKHPSLMEAWDRRTAHEKGMLAFSNDRANRTSNRALTGKGKGKGKDSNNEESDRDIAREEAR
ncbi:MAG: hypothetical protein AAGJ31_12000, partial [Verrucomicrobiota bacterium]